MNRTVAHIPIHDLCCSCGACLGICSQGAINFVFKQGLFIPEINEDKCVGCGLCARVCPSEQRKVEDVFDKPELFTEEERLCYTAYSKNERFRREGTSGGVVSTIIYELLLKGIYKKAYVLDYEVFDGKQGIIRPIECPDDVLKSAKSKYIPASIAEVVKDIFNGSIDKSIIVATPCQMLAIKESLKLNRKNEKDILFIGLFCDKTLNYNIYGYYRERFGEYDSLHFRDKIGNDWPGDTVLYKDGKTTVIDKRVRMSLKPYFQLNRCRFCFDKLNQLADISCGDCYIKGEESKDGKSSIIIWTQKGDEALKVCSLVHLEKSCMKDIKCSQGLMIKLENYNRNHFPNSPFIISNQKAETVLTTKESQDLKRIRLGETANDAQGYSRIDNHLAMKKSVKPTNNRAKRIINRFFRLFHYTDDSITILIDKVGFTNKGAELMLQSVVQQLEFYSPKVRIVVPQKVFYENLNYCHRHNILPLTLDYNRRKATIKRFLYQCFLNKPYYITPDYVDIVLDAGGFQFGDQWSISKKGISEKVKYYSAFTKENRKIVFLPQAFGPFEQPLSQELIKTVYGLADLFYARELESFNHLQSLFPESNKIKLAPDFTCLSMNNGLESIALPDDYIIVIPNVKMVTHTVQDVSDRYIDFLREVSEFLISKGETLVLLNHEGIDDLKLLLRLNDRLSRRVLLLSSLDALEIKRIIGGARLLISSRYNGVVSGLTQGIPTLCTSWSHKYHELMKEHGCENGILNINNLNQVKHIIEDALNNPHDYASKDGCISEVKKKTAEMWEEIWNITGLNRTSRN